MDLLHLTLVFQKKNSLGIYCCVDLRQQLGSSGWEKYYFRRCYFSRSFWPLYYLQKVHKYYCSSQINRCWLSLNRGQAWRRRARCISSQMIIIKVIIPCRLNIFFHMLPVWQDKEIMRQGNYYCKVLRESVWRMPQGVSVKISRKLFLKRIQWIAINQQVIKIAPIMFSIPDFDALCIYMMK